MRLSALVSPNSLPVIEATRSNSVSATRPQFRAPTMTSVAASRSVGRMTFLLCPGFVEGPYRVDPGLSSVCRRSVHCGGARLPQDRRVVPADGRFGDDAACLGAALRAASARAL